MKSEFIIRYEKVFSDEDCKLLIEQIDLFEENNILTQEFGETHMMDHKTMNLIYHYDMPTSTTFSQIFFDRIKSCVSSYLDTYSVLGQQKFLIYDCKLKKIPAGAGFHNWHFENAGLLVSQRHFTVQAYINDDFEGGETEFLYQNRREKAVAGDVIIFPCGYTHVHRGNPPIGGTKYLATTWGWIQSKSDQVTWN